MDRVVELIEDKIKYLEKLHKINQDELVNFSEGNFDGLEEFYNTREGVISLVNKIDSMIKSIDTIYDFSVAEASRSVKETIIQKLDYKNELVTEILSQDLQVITYIEEAKTSIIKDLAEVRTAKKVMNSYSSGQKTRNLDEKA